MASYHDLLDAIARIRSVTGDAEAWTKGLSGDDVTVVCNPASPPDALGAVLAKLTAAHPDVFRSPSPTGRPEPPPRVGEGAAADAIRDAETALAHQNTDAAHVDLQVVTAVLNAHAAHDEGLAELVALQRDIEAAVTSRTDLDTPAGAREFQRFLIAKLRDIRDVVEKSSLDATSKASLAAALATLYAATNSEPPEKGSAGENAPENRPAPSDPSRSLQCSAAENVSGAALPAAATGPFDSGTGLPPYLADLPALEPAWDGPPLSGPALDLPYAPAGPQPAPAPPAAPLPAPIAPPPAMAAPPATAMPPWGAGMPAGAPFGGGMPALASPAFGSPVPPASPLPDLPKAEPPLRDRVLAGDAPPEAVTGEDQAAGDQTGDGPISDPGTTVELPDGDAVTAPSPALAAAITAAVGGAPIADAFLTQGITLPPPGSPVTAALDPTRLTPGDIGLFTDRHALSLGHGKALLDQQIQPIDSVGGPGFLGWQHPPAPEPALEPPIATPDVPAPSRSAATAPS